MADRAVNVDEERMRRIEELVHRLDTNDDGPSREVAEQLMQAVLDLHGAGLEKMMELAFEAGPSGETLIRRFANDSLVSSLLVLHGLHPDDLETRVQQVLVKVPGHAELMGVFEGVVRIRIPAGGCGSGDTDEESLKNILREAVPDIVDIVIQTKAAINSFVPLLSINGLASRAG